MKVYIGIKYHKDHRNKDMIEKLVSSLEKKGYQTTCIVEDNYRGQQKFTNPIDLMKATFEIIDGCDLVIIDLSEKGVGLGIEAGYAYAKAIPVITIAKYGSDVSETLEGISKSIIFYDKIEDLEIQL